METKRKDYFIMLFSGLAVLLGDLVLVSGALSGGLQFFNIPLSINNMIDLFSDFSAFMEQFSTDYVTLEITIVLLILVAIVIALIAELIITIIRFFGLIKPDADSASARKKYSSFLKTAGGIHAICGGFSLCSAATDPELSSWSIAMITLAFVYIVLMTIVTYLLDVSEEGAGKSAMRIVGSALLCAAILCVTLFYTKPVLTSAYDGLKNIVVYSYSYSKGEFIVNASDWVQLLIAMTAGWMLSSTIYAVSPIYNEKGKKKSGMESFIVGIVLVVLAIGVRVGEYFLFSSETATVFATVYTLIPLLLCSVTGLIAIGGLITQKKRN